MGGKKPGFEVFEVFITHVLCSKLMCFIKYIYFFWRKVFPKIFIYFELRILKFPNNLFETIDKMADLEPKIVKKIKCETAADCSVS